MRTVLRSFHAIGRRETASGDGAPGFPTFFLDGVYFQEADADEVSATPEWGEWFLDRGVRKRFSIANGPHLTDVCQYFAKHRPEKLIGVLHEQHPWNCFEETEDLELDEDHEQLIQEVGNLQVLCEGGKMSELRTAYLPVATFERFARQFLQGEEFFPWLQLEDGSSVWASRGPIWSSCCKSCGICWKRIHQPARRPSQREYLNSRPRCSTALRCWRPIKMLWTLLGELRTGHTGASQQKK
jgi:hypothetical protein